MKIPLLVVACLLAWSSLAAIAAERPNIVLIYADDIGYGDLGCYGATAVKTPHLDRIAREGLRFTDGHCGSATCTPSRYSLMTGQYAWRKPGTGILAGNASLIIPPGTPTLASTLRSAGYTTGVVGKWHLGLGTGDLDWNADIKPGPLEIGFDYCFLIPATGDRVPCVYVENHRVAGLDPADPIRVDYSTKTGDDPTGREHPELLKIKLTHGHDMTIVNGISRIGYMSGGKAARWVDEDMADTITDKAVKFIEKNDKSPFFLYFATHDIHVPRVPHSRFAGSTSLGPRGDVIQELDWSVGQILATLDRLKLVENTLVIFSSDNGPVLDDGYADDAVERLGSHKPAGPYRGGKYSIYEGGTRVPFLARWPARIKPAVSPALISQLDLVASFAELTGQKLTADAAPDSMNVLPALLGESQRGRELLVEHANGLAIRRGNWKYIAGPAEGKKGGKVDKAKTPGAAALFDLTSDVGETRNVLDQNPAIVDELTGLLQKIRDSDRSRP
ncbi:MAG TPA: arylsulfatase [Pirellulaceae bacterium]|nr:arylsulfatase [Pirellulaceae bacterium]